MREFKAIPYTALNGLHNGKDIVIVGGGQSALENKHRIPEDAIIISANQHAFNLGLNVDYMVFMDSPKVQPHLRRRVEDLKGAKTITENEEFADYFIEKRPRDLWLTGSLCTWLACQMTNKNVILFGIDCYQKGSRYFHDENNSIVRTDEVQGQLLKWKIASKKYINPGRVYSVSFPLNTLFKPW